MVSHLVPLIPPPSRLDALRFRTKVVLLQGLRAAGELRSGRPRRHTPGDALRDAPIVAESSTPLFTAEMPAERPLELGKIENLRIATRRLHGLHVPAGELVSFWRQVGRTSRARGYVDGRELREGCVIPSRGGGLCQLSNGLFDAVERAGFEIVERHRHSRIVPGSLAEVGRDATVFWNYVDLRFRAPCDFRLEVELTDRALAVRIRCDGDPQSRPAPLVATARPLAVTGDCATCEQTTCHRKTSLPDTGAGARGERTAWLVDDVWPEFDAYLRDHHGTDDVLGVPIDGERRGHAGYAWSTAGFDRVREARTVTLRRSLRSRRLRAQGAERQRALLGFDRALARAHARLLTPDITHVVTTQSLLPHLFAEGLLGGRSFDVLMTRLPLADLEARLDAASRRHPESPTLGDFRAPAWLARTEDEALARARRFITPHTDIASVLGAERVVHLRWSIPTGRSAPVPGSRVAFAGSTLGRHGAYELRSAALRAGLPLRVVGASLEAPDFWQGVECDRLQPGTDWLAGCAVVAAPHWVDHRPRRALEAIARGVPVVASRACGLRGLPGVTEIEIGDVDGLCEALSHGVDRPESVVADARGV